jgi:hypothetical protein
MDSLQRQGLDKNTLIMLFVVVAAVWFFFFKKEEEKFTSKKSFGAIVYEDSDYKGRTIGLPVGKYNLDKLEKLGMPNNTISSVLIMPGHAITAFEDDNFTGKNIIISDSQRFVGQDINDKISSIIVSKK